jgi:hypothetical protein
MRKTEIQDEEKHITEQCQAQNQINFLSSPEKVRSRVWTPGSEGGGWAWPIALTQEDLEPNSTASRRKLRPGLLALRRLRLLPATLHPHSSPPFLSR